MRKMIFASGAVIAFAATTTAILMNRQGRVHRKMEPAPDGAAGQQPAGH